MGHTDHMRESPRSVAMKFLNRLATAEIEGTRFWSLAVVMIISLLLFWAGTLVYAYIADDRSAMPADERSVPPPRSY